MRNRIKLKFATLFIFALLAVLVSATLGSVYIPLREVVQTIFNKSNEHYSILLEVRFPRIMTSFVVGAALSISGVVIQSVLQNVLASSYTLGVSAGASLGAAIVIVTGFSLPFFSFLTLPIIGFIFALATVMLTMFVASKVDNGLSNYTIVLIGMMVSLFVNALLTTISALNRGHMQQLLLWQMGSFSSKYWNHFLIITVVTLICFFIVIHYHKEMDIIAFGDTQSQTIGVSSKNVKWILLIFSSLLTGTAVCFTGIIGFIDLISPQLMRKLFGASHRYLIPASALFGGGFMVICDTVSRIILLPEGLPVGAVMALLGAPFFIWVFLQSRKQV